MNQLSFRIKSDEYDLIRRWADENDISIANAYKIITKDAIKMWKMEYLLQEYAKGAIRLKEAWKLSNLAFMEFMKLLEEYNIEPPHTRLVELKSAEKRQLIETDRIFKKKHRPVRKTPELDLPDID